MVPVTGRQAPQLKVPDPALLRTGFPVRNIPTGRVFYRAFVKGRNPWFFDSMPERARFNLTGDSGTCYLAVNAETAIWERFGEELNEFHAVVRDDVQKMNLVQLALPSPVTAAATGSKRAKDFGCLREISTTGDYALTCKWAEAFHRIAMEGIFYGSRFTSESAMNAMALFGRAGEAPWPDPAAVEGVAAMQSARMGQYIGPKRPSTDRARLRTIKPK